MDEKLKILLCEDDENLGMLLREYLQAKGYQAVLCQDGEVGYREFAKGKFDIAVLDVMMPKKDGFTLAQEIRQANTEIPIIFLTARALKDDILEGFKIGADDYITKPFQSMELVARVRSHLRRYEQILNLKNETKNEDEYMIGDLVLNNTTKRVTLNSRDIKLTPKEFDILKLLISHPGQVFSSQQIYELVWKEEAINTETIMVHIRKLREKIETNPKKPIYIKVVWGQGYKMENIQ